MDKNSMGHVDIEILEMLANNQHGQLSEDVLNAVLEHISCCLICWEQLRELDDCRKMGNVKEWLEEHCSYGGQTFIF